MVPGFDTYLQGQAARVLALPESMNNVQLDQMSDILVEGGQDEIDVMHVIELPAFRNKWIPEDVLERNAVFIQLGRQVADLYELEW